MHTSTTHPATSVSFATARTRADTADGGHGGIFQYHRQFVATALEFLAR